MLFNSFIFVFFFLGVYTLYRLLPFRAQNLLLLAASYFFYGYWDWRFLILIWLSSSMDFLVAQAVHDTPDPRRRRRLLMVSVCVNLGILFVFKYYGFFSESLQALLSAFGLHVSWSTLHIVLPVGISFYTFQTMSYTLDVYRGQLAPTRHYLNYLLFVSFFPQLVAGPIERAGNLLGQVERPRTISRDHWREGAWLILLGYYKKVVLADNLAPFANEVFNAPGEACGLQVLAGLLAFAFQIYGDFSGYSDIARGVARLMGFDLMLNFRMPYFAVNPSDFWRRWHISLSTWLRDYLYIPLGGNRGGEVRMYRNLALTMLLGGLWHGAAWHFVAWGAYHGLLLIAFRVAGVRETPRSRPAQLFSMAGFFVLTLIGWLLFRANRLADVPLLLHRMVQPWAWNGKLILFSILLFAGPLLVLEYFQERSRDMLAVLRWPVAVRWLVFAGLLLALVVSGAMETYEFIYFQF
ncbi:MAG: MBOAT family protein [Kiritimatiellae bacterium]|nr:MBOAT family protein [Kiritimatiellia bacterium]